MLVSSIDWADPPSRLPCSPLPSTNGYSLGHWESSSNLPCLPPPASRGRRGGQSIYCSTTIIVSRSRKRRGRRWRWRKGEDGGADLEETHLDLLQALEEKTLEPGAEVRRRRQRAGGGGAREMGWEHGNQPTPTQCLCEPNPT